MPPPPLNASHQNFIKILKLLLCLFLVVTAISSATRVPVIPPAGLDFQGVYAYHHCNSLNPYIAGGMECHDRLNRVFAYPPLFFSMFAWTRLLGLDTAFNLWTSFVLFAFLGTMTIWKRPGQHPAQSLFFWILLGLQFPMLFLLERGNTDILILFSWSLSYFLWKNRRPMESGFVAGLTVPMKLYPAFAIVALLIACLFHKSKDRRTLSYGILLGVILGAGVLLPSFLYYLSHSLPEFVRDYGSDFSVLAHSVPRLFPKRIFLGYLIWMAPIFLWGISGRRNFEKNSDLYFSSALAMSTFLTTCSFDYNLTTTFPFVFVLFQRTRSILDAFFVGLGTLGLYGQFLLEGHALNLGIVRFCIILVFVVGESIKYWKTETAARPIDEPQIKLNLAN